MQIRVIQLWIKVHLNSNKYLSQQDSQWDKLNLPWAS